VDRENLVAAELAVREMGVVTPAESSSLYTCLVAMPFVVEAAQRRAAVAPISA
jgi:hypothetical protein